VWACQSDSYVILNPAASRCGCRSVGRWHVVTESRSQTSRLLVNCLMINSSTVHSGAVGNSAT
jgi:hypothetical protein